MISAGQEKHVMASCRVNMGENVTWTHGQFSPLVSLFVTVLPLINCCIAAAYQGACLQPSQVTLVSGMNEKPDADNEWDRRKDGRLKPKFCKKKKNNSKFKRKCNLDAEKLKYFLLPTLHWQLWAARAKILSKFRAKFHKSFLSWRFLF